MSASPTPLSIPKSVDVMALGSIRVLWLPAQAHVPATDIGLALSVAEHAYSETLKSSARKAEFMRSRWLIRQALGTTTEQAPLQRAADGVISWPNAWVGSLSHKDGHVAFAAADAAQVRGLGIDIENTARLKVEFEPRLCHAQESYLLDRLCQETPLRREDWLAVMFSFKEALFKCHFPLGRVLFYFLDAEIEAIDYKTGRLRARLLRQVSPYACQDQITHGFYKWHQVQQSVFAVTACSQPF